MTRTGVAIVPSAGQIRSVVELQARLMEVTALRPRLGVVECVPHVTLLQGRADGPLCSEDTLRRLATDLAARGEDLCSRGTGLVYRARGWYFLALDNTGWLHELHARVVDACRDRLRVATEDLAKDLTGYTDSEVENYRRYGYRYIGADYRPHVTLGRTPDRRRAGDEAKLMARFHNARPAIEIRPDHLSVYEIGRDGAHLRAKLQARVGGASPDRGARA